MAQSSSCNLKKCNTCKKLFKCYSIQNLAFSLFAQFFINSTLNDALSRRRDLFSVYGFNSLSYYIGNYISDYLIYLTFAGPYIGVL